MSQLVHCTVVIIQFQWSNRSISELNWARSNWMCAVHMHAMLWRCVLYTKRVCRCHRDVYAHFFCIHFFKHFLWILLKSQSVEWTKKKRILLNEIFDFEHEMCRIGGGAKNDPHYAIDTHTYTYTCNLQLGNSERDEATKRETFESLAFLRQLNALNTISNQSFGAKICTRTHKNPQPNELRFCYYLFEMCGEKKMHVWLFLPWILCGFNRTATKSKKVNRMKESTLLCNWSIVYVCVCTILIRLCAVFFCFWIGSKWPVKAASVAVQLIRDVNFSHDILDMLDTRVCVCVCICICMFAAASYNLNFLDFVMAAYCCVLPHYLCYCHRVGSIGYCVVRFFFLRRLPFLSWCMCVYIFSIEWLRTVCLP